MALLSDTQISYLRELRPYIGASVCLLVLGTLLGALTGSRFLQLEPRFNESLKSFVQIFTGLPKPLLALAIFLNNSLKTFAVMGLGLAGGLVPAAFLLINGYALGLVFTVSTESRGIISSLVAIVPHGILEIPAVLLGTSIGMELGMYAIKRLFGHAHVDLKSETARALRFFAVVIIPLLFMAALVEAFITASLVGK